MAEPLAPGTYTAYNINIDPTDAVAVQSALQTGDTFPLILPAGLCYELTNGVSFTILAPLDPACFECEAAIGSLNVAGNDSICGTVSGVITLTGGTTLPGYETVITVLDLDGQQISSYPSGSIIDFSDDGFLFGTVTVIGVNYYAADSANCNATTEPFLFTLIPLGDPFCCPADYGMVVGESTTLCPNGQVTFTVTGDFTDGFGTHFVVVNPDQTFSITDDPTVTLSGTGQIETYTVHALNVSDADFATIMAADLTTITELINFLNANVPCKDFNAAGISVTMQPANSSACCAIEPTTLALEGDVDTLCAGAVTGNFTIENAPLIDIYTSFLTISDGTTGTLIAAPLLVSSLDLTDLGLGTGSYTVCGFTYDLFYSDAVNIGVAELLASGGTAADIAALEACIVQTTNCITLTVLDSLSSFCCGSNVGVVTAPTNITYCTGQVSQSLTITGNSMDGFTTIYIVEYDAGTDISPSIVGYTTNPFLDFSVAPFNVPGIYNLYALNVSNADTAAVFALINGTIGTGTEFLNFDLTGFCVSSGCNGCAAYLARSGQSGLFGPVASDQHCDDGGRR